MSTLFNQQQKLVFDIETVGVDFNSLDEISREYLLKFAEDEEEKEEIREKRLGFYPLTGEIVTIGVLNPDTNKGASFVKENMNGNIKNQKLSNEFEMKIEIGSEKEILEKFWETIKAYNCFISFNGRAFDVPFLMIRSAILGIKPSKNLLANRYLNYQPGTAQHIDLADQLTFYGASKRHFPLHLWTKAFGIDSPKEEGISGENVGQLFNEGKLFEIVKYNLGDLKATKELYEKWEKYLNL